MQEQPHSSQVIDRRRQGRRRRVVNACFRCRQQKIRCSGSHPCDQCTKRDLNCTFEDKSQKIWVSRGFIDDLQTQAQKRRRSSSLDPSTRPQSANNGSSRNSLELTNAAYTNEVRQPKKAARLENHDDTEQWHSDSRPGEDSGTTTPTAQMTNPFTQHFPRYVTARDGRPLYLGTSSNWAFSRRVLDVAHSHLAGEYTPAEIITYYHKPYNLNWRDPKDRVNLDQTCLPSADHALYLINAVKFHCSQIFHLFDEASFMQEFHNFQAGLSEPTTSQGLWYIHYLLILAFGKVFVARRRDPRRPPGADLLEKAMDLLPNVVVLSANPIQAVEILCCMALYLQCLDFRGPAHAITGQALRIAMEEGMHTSMQDHGLDATLVQRCRNVWWTIYILDLQMSSLQGLPLILRDEDISASLPSSSGRLQESLALAINVKLSRVLAQTLTTVYGREGKLSKRFIQSTKNVLRNIALVTDELKSSFPLPLDGSASGASRLSAHLHLLHHQCIILAIRPLLFSLSKWSLESLVKAQQFVINSSSARKLLQMCIESSQHTITIVNMLKEQDLLETFLPFDLEATYVASMIILLAPLVVHSFKTSSSLDLAFSVIEEMRTQGSLQAEARKTELQIMQQLFGQLSNVIMGEQDIPPASEQKCNTAADLLTGPDNGLDLSQNHIEFGIGDDTGWENVLTADNLNLVAESLDLEGIDWLTTASSHFDEYF